MKKQRICIVGDGLSGLITVIALNNLPNLIEDTLLIDNHVKFLN